MTKRFKSPPLFSRLPPHWPEGEMAVIGCQLIAPNDCVPEVLEKFHNSSLPHYDARHQLIQSEIFTMFDARIPIGVIEVRQRLNEKGVLHQVGGDAYLSQLADSVPSASNLSYWLEKVCEKFLLRKMIQTCTSVVGRVYDYEGEVDALLDEVERDVLRISESRAQKAAGRTIETIVDESIQGVEKMFTRQGSVSGLATGFADLDHMTDGLHGSEMVVIAARPSTGKTSIAMNIVERVCIEDKQPVAVFSLEMGDVSLVTRMACSLARVNLRAVRDGFLSQDDFKKMASAYARIRKSPLFIDESASLSVLEIRARARRWHQQHGIKLVVVDYLQLVKATGKRAQENRQQEVSDISAGLKALAKELKIPVLVLSQMNRAVESRKDFKPKLSDLRESGAIEQDADFVGFLYKPSASDEEHEEQDGVAVNLYVAKQRNGPVGDVRLTFLKSITRFESAAKIADEDCPQK